MFVVAATVVLPFRASTVVLIVSVPEASSSRCSNSAPSTVRGAAYRPQGGEQGAHRREVGGGRTGVGPGKNHQQVEVDVFQVGIRERRVALRRVKSSDDQTIQSPILRFGGVEGVMGRIGGEKVG